jgi:hypothetical protein
VGGGKMPSAAEVQAVSVYSGYNANTDAQGTAYAAGWPVDDYYLWIGEADDPDYARDVNFRIGDVNYMYILDEDSYVVCRR